MIKKTSQLFFNFSTDPYFSWDDFFINESNSEAAKHIKAWPAWLSRCSIIYGNSGSGKTYLANLWKKRNHATFITDKTFTELPYYRSDNWNFILDEWNSNTNEKSILHLYNLIHENKGYLLILSKKPPSLLEIKIPDLESRLKASTAIKLDNPDDKLLTIIAIKLFSDLQIQIKNEIINYLINYTERSPNILKKNILLIYEESIKKKKKISLHLIKNLINSKKLI